MLYILDIIGTAIFAVTGSLAAKRNRMDVFGVIVLGLVTAIGGGTFRDIILGAIPVFWVTNNNYIITAVFFSVITFIVSRFWEKISGILIVFDAFGLAVFTIVGCDRTLILGYSGIIVITMGVMTGVLGGIIRDLLSGEVPLILKRQIYATASFLGAVFFVSAESFIKNRSLLMLVSISIIVVIRLAALRLHLSLPAFNKPKSSDESEK